MADAVLRLILEAQNKNAGEIEDLKDELSGATDATAELTDADDELIRSLGEVEEAAQDAGESVEELGEEGETAGKKGKSALDKWAQEQGLKQKFEILKMAIESVGKAFDFADAQAQKLGRVDVSQNIAHMREEFGDLTDSLVQVKFSLLDVWPGMDKTNEALQSLGMNTDSLTKKRDFLDWMGDAAAGATNAMNWMQALSIQMQLANGAITQEEAASRAAALAHVDVALTTEQLAQAQRDLQDPLDESNRLEREQADALLAAEAAQRAANAAAELATGIYGLAASALAGANVPLFQKIELENQLAIASGATTQEELDQKEAIGFLTKQLELGNISLETYKQKIDELASGAADAKQVINETSDAINNIPDRDVYLNYHYQTFGSEPGGDAPVITPDDGDNAVYGGAQAEGGDYWVTKPTWFLAGEAGPERATFAPEGKDRPRENIKGGDTYILNVNTVQSAGNVARDFAVMRVLAGA